MQGTTSSYGHRRRRGDASQVHASRPMFLLVSIAFIKLTAAVTSGERRRLAADTVQTVMKGTWEGGAPHLQPPSRPTRRCSSGCSFLFAGHLRVMEDVHDDFKVHVPRYHLELDDGSWIHLRCEKTSSASVTEVQSRGRIPMIRSIPYSALNISCCSRPSAGRHHLPRVSRPQGRWKPTTPLTVTQPPSSPSCHR